MNRPERAAQVVEEHTAIVDALRARDSVRSRAAMRMHLEAVITHLLFAVEEKAIAEARKSVAMTRARFGATAQI